MKKNLMVIPPVAVLLFALACPWAATASAEPKSSQTPSIGIGEGEGAKTHRVFDKSIPKGAKIVKVSTHLIVDKASPNGLNFFAIPPTRPGRTAARNWSGNAVSRFSKPTGAAW